MSGAFSRMGFGARGMGMGNAMVSVVNGNLVSYYNPAVSTFQEGNLFQTSYSFLSLDRTLNFLSFTKKLEIGKRKKRIAGISIGIINAGVSGIDGRDNQGLKTGDLSTSENQFFLSFSNRFSDKFSLGVGIKFYYFKLYEQITSTALGIDIGAIYLLNKNISLAASINDINSKYKWDTSNLYGLEGNSTRYNFPLLFRFGVSYKLSNPNLLASVEFEHSDAQTDFIRVGAEYNIFENLFLRGGVDRISISNFDIPARPSLGFSYLKKFDSFKVGINYAFVMEPYSSYDSHIIGVEIIF
jgi:opacity protein-like surface antigen